MSLAHDVVAYGNSKITFVDKLARRTTWRRANGLTVVHAHGCWDLLHHGHVRHLRSARDMGDLLVVTVTSDRYVNKGPGRPVFTAMQRAEMLAALEYVDFVAINDSPDAVDAINAIRPSIYVKGRDYHNADEGLAKERAAVEMHDGKLVITDDELMSSSALINRHLSGLSQIVREHLDELRPSLSEILSWIDGIKDYRVLMIGDAIIDEYQYVVPIGKPPKEHIVATRYQDVEVFAGGVFAAANHIASFVKQVDVVTAVGDDQGLRIGSSKTAKNVNIKALEVPKAPTTRKIRWVDRPSMRKLFEVYHMDDNPIDDRLRRHMAHLCQKIADYDLVIIADFGHGLVDHTTIDLVSKAKFLAVNTQTNSANYGYNLITKYNLANYICIDEPEARLAASDRVSALPYVAEHLAGKITCMQWLITRGKHGSLHYDHGFGYKTFPALADTVVDTVGAGDAVFAITAPLVKAGMPREFVGFIGNVVGSMAVGIVGNRSSVGKTDLIRSVTGLLK